MAPALIARTDIGTSPCPVMKMTGRSIFELGHLALEIEPAEARQADVEHEAAGRVGPFELQEFFGRGERAHAEVNRTNETVERLPQRRDCRRSRTRRAVVSLTVPRPPAD